MRQKSYAENSESNLEDAYFLTAKKFLILEKEGNNMVKISV